MKAAVLMEFRFTMVFPHVWLSSLVKPVMFFVMSYASCFCFSAEKENEDRSWWHPAWPYRRTVSIQGREKGYAVVRFNTFGRCAPGGSDIAVVADDRHFLRQRVLLDSGRDDMVIIAFPVVDPDRRYSIYFGNLNLKEGRFQEPYVVDDLNDPHQERFLPKAGLLLEVRALGEGGAETLEAMEELIDASTTVLGRTLRRNCLLGMNPFGKQDEYLAVWYGVLRITRSGTWGFATNSNGPSFVLVDGSEVCSWPGWHGAGGGSRGQHNGTVTLTRGLHRFAYYFAAKGGRHGMICGIREPDDPSSKHKADSPADGKPPEKVEKPFRPLGPGHLQPLLRCSAGALEDVYSENRVDFNWRIVSDMGLSGRAVCLVRFEDRSAIKEQKIVSWKWRFGDGRTGRGKKTEHVYLKGGSYVVETELTTAGGTVIRNSATLAIHPQGNRNLSVSDAVRRTEAVAWTALSEEEYRTLLFLRWQDGRDDLRLFWDAAWRYFEREPQLKDRPVQTYADVLLDRLFLRDHTKLIRLARFLLKTSAGGALKEKACRMAGTTLWHLQKKRDEALALWKQHLDDAAGGGSGTKLLLLLVSDGYDAAGNSESAVAFFKKAETRRPAADGSLQGKQRLPGEYAYKVGYFTRQKEYGRAWKLLHEWIETTPGILKTGDASFFRAEILSAMGFSGSALSELERTIEKAGAVRRHAALVNAHQLAGSLGLEEKKEKFKEMLQAVKRQPSEKRAVNPAPAQNGK